MDAKAHILIAAQAVFARHGFRQTAMAMVAEAAGLSRQALYHHFASKEALFAALVDALYEAAFAAAKSAAAQRGGSASGAIAGMMIAHHRALGSRLSASPFLAELIEESGRQCGPAVAAHARRFEKELEALCVRLIREGQFKVRAGVTAREVAEMVTMAAKGAKARHAGDHGARYERALARMIDVICAGVAPPAAVAAARRRNRIPRNEPRLGRIAR
jgi:AcrR family transcriptional regulator